MRPRVPVLALLLVVVLCGLSTTVAAQGPGYFISPQVPTPLNCPAAFTAPTANQTVCFDSTTGRFLYWNGSAWVFVITGGGGGGGTPGAPTGAVQFNDSGSFGGSTAPIYAKAFASLQAAITAAPAGGIVQAECQTYNENLVIPKALTLQGCFSGEGAFGTVINGGSGTAVKFSQAVYGTGFGYALRNIKTTGTGIGVHLFQTVAAKLEYVQTDGHSTAVLLEAAPVTTIMNSQFQNYTACGVCMSNTVATDNGDIHIAYNQFSSATPGPVAKSIGWTSGSGVYITANKFLGPATTIIDINNDQTAATDFIVANNNIEHGVSGGYALRVRNNGSAGFTNVAVTGNQFTTAIYTHGVSIEGVTNAIDGVTITGNGFGDMAPGAGTTYINLTKATTFSVTGNSIIGPAGAVHTATGINIDSTSAAGSVSSNVMSQITTRITNASANQVTILDNANGDVSFFGLTSLPPPFTTLGGIFTVNNFNIRNQHATSGGGFDCLQIDASGNVTKTGAACGTGSGGVASVQGTANQVLVNALTTPQTGAVVLTLPSAVIAPGSLAVTNLGGSGVRCIHVDNAGVMSVASGDCATGGSGSVTNFTAGNLPPVFTTSVATPSTTPALTFSLSTQTANTFFAGPSSAGPSAPTFRALVAADLPSGAVATSVTGTANQITASPTTGAVVLTLPATIIAPGSVQVTTRTGTPNTFATFDASGKLADGATYAAPAPASAQYWTGAADPTLTAEKNLGALTTGLVLNTAGTPSAYAGTTCTNQFVRSLNASGVATCATVANTDLASASTTVNGVVCTLGGVCTVPAVTSVAMTVPSILAVAGSPITTSGTLAVSLTTQTANTVFSGPSTAGPSVPTFRALVAADLPTGSLPAAPVGATQFNNTGVFGGAAAPLHTGAFGTTRAQLQNAINATPVGGWLQLDCAVNYTLDGTALVVNKAMTFSGCASQGGGVGTTFPASAVITGVSGQTVITIDTYAGATIRDLTIKNASGGTGILVTNTALPSGGRFSSINVRSKILNTWIDSGSYGIRGETSRAAETIVQNNYISNSTISGIAFGGVANPNAGFVITGNTHTTTTVDGITPNTTGLTVGMPVFGSGIPSGTYVAVVNSSSQITLSTAATSTLTGTTLTVSASNCDGGGYKVSHNMVETNTGTANAYVFLNSAALSFISNSDSGALNRALHLQIGPASAPCVSSGPTQVEIIGNQLTGFNSYALLIEDFFSTGSYEIANNFFGTSATVDVTKLVSTVQGIFGVTYMGNVHQTINQVGAGAVLFDGVFASTVSGNVLSMASNVTNYLFKAVNTGYGLVVTDNTATNPVPNSQQYQGSGYYLRVNDDRGAMLLANIPNVLPGSHVQCTDCVRGTNPCIAGADVDGKSTTAFRVGAAGQVVWSCSLGTPQWTASGLSTAQTGAQNKTALLAMIAALPTTGGHLTLPTGNIVLDPGITIDRPLVIEGAVQSAPNGTMLITTSTTADLFVVTTSSPVTFRNLGIGPLTTPVTAGAYIHFNGSPINNGSFVENVGFIDCFICLDFEAAKAWRVTNSQFQTRSTANAIGIWQHSTDPSFGGFSIDRSQFNNGTALGTAIKITSGGNTNIGDNIFFGMAKAIWFDWVPAAGSGTFKVSRNTFTGGNTPITLQTEAGGGNLAFTMISNNIFSQATPASIVSTSGALYSDVTITDNQIVVSASTVGVDLGTARATIVGNLFDTSGTATAGINVQAAASDTHIEANKFLGTYTNQVVDLGATTTNSINSYGTNLVLPKLASANLCLTTNASGLLSTTACSGGGSGTVTSIATTAPITGGTITGTGTIGVTDFVASGASHARGTVPDPGASAGTTRFLREDATWAVPAGGGTVTGTGTTGTYTKWTSSSAIGDSGTSEATPMFLLGSNTVALTDVYVGSGFTKASPATTTIQNTGGSGTNNAGGILVLAGGKGTGTGVPGSINFATSTLLGSGTTLQSLTNRWQVTGTTLSGGNPGDLIAVTDGTVNIGATGANRPDKVFVKTALTVGSVTYPIACGTQSYAPLGSGAIAGPNGNWAPSGTVGQMICTRFQQACSASNYTKLGFRVNAAGAASSQCQAGIYSADGSTLIVAGAVQTCDTASVNKSTTGLTAFSLVPGTEYLVCMAASVTATMTLSGMTSSPAVNVFSSTNVLSTNVAQFNQACTGSGAPYACCTGSTTGSCTGFPASTGALSNSTNAVMPFVAIAP